MQEITCGLDRCFLCRHCIPEWKELIALRKKTFLIKRGKQLFREGEKVTGIFFLYSGTVKVHVPWTDEKEMIIRFARAGDVVGHRGLGGEYQGMGDGSRGAGGGGLYPVSATALEDTVACWIPSDFLEATLRANPALTYTLMQLYAAELQKAEKRMRELAHMDVKGRIAGALLEIAALFGLDKDNYITVALTRQDIASYAGTTYETIFKFFAELGKMKAISTSGKSIRINKPEALKKFIGRSRG
jgi:CRP-like cAMP-binding protein